MRFRKQKQKEVSGDIDDVIKIIEEFKKELNDKYDKSSNSREREWWDTQECCMTSFKNYLLKHFQSCDLEKCSLQNGIHCNCIGTSEEYNSCNYQKALKERTK